MCLIQENLGTVSQVECAVAEIFSLLVISLSGILFFGQRRCALSERVNDALGIRLAGNSSDVWLDVGGPAGRITILLINELTSESSGIFDNRIELGCSSLVLAGEDVNENGLDSGDITGVGDLGDLSILDGTNTDKSIETLLSLLTSLRISQVLVVLGQTRHKLWQERGDNVGILDKLAHVVDDNGRLSLDSSLTLSETTIEERNHNSESWLVDISNEGGGTE
jgi:hypothetical protein